jgi:hypothetical protein
LRLPTTAGAGRPAAAAARAIADDRSGLPAACGLDRARRHDRQQSQQGGREQDRSGAQDEPVGLEPAGGVEPAHRADRGQRGDGDRARHGEDRGGEHRDGARQACRQPGLGTGGAQRPHGGDVRPGPAEQLGKSLAHQDEHGQGREGAEDGQRDRLRPDRLLHLAPGDVGAVDVEGQPVQIEVLRLADLPLHPAGQPGQLGLERRYPGNAAVETHPDPPVLVRPEQPPGRGGRENPAILLVGRVGQDRRDVHDRGHPECGATRRDLLAGLGILVGELVGHVPADAHAERPGHAPGQRDLTG